MGTTPSPRAANLACALTGHARVPTSGQILDRQARALTEAGCIRIFAGRQPGKTPAVPSSPRAWTTSAPATPSSSRAWTGCPGPCRT